MPHLSRTSQTEFAQASPTRRSGGLPFAAADEFDACPLQVQLVATIVSRALQVANHQHVRMGRGRRAAELAAGRLRTQSTRRRAYGPCGGSVLVLVGSSGATQDVDVTYRVAVLAAGARRVPDVREV